MLVVLPSTPLAHDVFHDHPDTTHDLDDCEDSSSSSPCSACCLICVWLVECASRARRSARCLVRETIRGNALCFGTTYLLLLVRGSAMTEKKCFDDDCCCCCCCCCRMPSCHYDHRRCPRSAVCISLNLEMIFHHLQNLSVTVVL